MPSSSRQDRYEHLIMPENAYNALDPHPQAQTLYGYPFPTHLVFLALLSCLIPGFIVMMLGHYRTSIICYFAFLIPGLAVALLIHPKVGREQKRQVETPQGVQIVHVHRPFFGRRKCETLYGVTGGNSTSETRGIFNDSRTLLRHEPAFCVVDW